jgi:hypothetical protein
VMEGEQPIQVCMNLCGRDERRRRLVEARKNKASTEQGSGRTRSPRKGKVK